ncbi:hypothetical protein LSCM1_02733 [Leishmania martiniquensis]|uniref:PPPDE domain-containing protein n=1 Tax=Leishmania martiniquensis TaxID=1580590 RepID=A0A836H325_9TRYP|nr:hypothetical protein LSCM1_02733 [Leishmania martiniquensis]
MSSSALSAVALYRYDLTHGMGRSLGAMLTGQVIEGIWHTSIVVYGKEFYFDGGVGIVGDPHPGHTRFGRPDRTEVLGQTTKREEEFLAWTEQQRHAGFGPNDYRILDNNCNSFSDAASMYLLGRHISEDVLSMIPTLLSTPFGQILRPMLERAISRDAGVGDTGVAAPFNSSLPAPPPPASAGNGDVCAGLLSTRSSVTEAEEEDLMVAKAMLESNETIADGHRSPAEAFEQTISGLTLLRTAMMDICEHPSNAKYRALSTQSTTYQTKLKPLEAYGVTEILRVAGFRRRPHSSGTGGEQWFLSDSDGSEAVLRRVAEILELTIANIQTAADVADKKRRKELEIDSLEPSPRLPRPPAPACDAASASKDSGHAHRSSAIRFCSPPFPEGWSPLSVGRESGAPLFSIRCPSASGADAPWCFGKCRLTENQKHLQAYYCSGSGKEVEVYGDYEVLCVRRGEEKTLTWVPAPLASTAQTQHSAQFIFWGYGRFGVARAEQGGGLHPGVMEPSGRCVVPYGGRAVVVTNEAEVLCETATLPPAVTQELQNRQHGSYLAELLRAASGQPIDSFHELLNTWKRPVLYMKPRTLRPRTVLGQAPTEWGGAGDANRWSADHTAGGGSSSAGTQSAPPSSLPLKSRLLVCHDMAGGYTRADRRLFLCEGGPVSATASAGAVEGSCKAAARSRLQAVEDAYTVSYWSRVDYFVYFSHRRITVPPREWIDSGHSHGVPVLGTVITEGIGPLSELALLLTDPKHMAAIIARLVEVCDVYGFDGYLINIETSLPETLAKRLAVFCTQLRKQLNRSSSAARGASPATLATERAVIWYDAVTIEGPMRYQNALTPQNKPFFDASDGIFINYFWKPENLPLTAREGGDRGADIYVGVDVFGRRMFGGGGYHTHVAVAEVTHARLSVALFAPAWTMECESEGKRDGFQQAESRLWFPFQEELFYHALLISSPAAATEGAAQQPKTNEVEVARHEPSLCVWTSFQSGVGYDFYVNGRRVTGDGAAASVAATSGWCELSGSHNLPPFLFQAPPPPLWSKALPPAARGAAPSRQSPFAPVPIRLPVTAFKGSIFGDSARAEWRYDKAWFGDCYLMCFVPPMEAVELLRWYVCDALPATPLTELHIEVIFDETDATEERAEVHRGLRLGLYSPTRGPLQATIWERTAAAVEGVSDLAVRVLRERESENVDETGATGAASGWERVTYQLRNTSSEPLHLTSLSVANGDPRRTLDCGVGAIAIVHRRAETPTAATGADAHSASTKRHAVLRLHGPHSWESHHTLRTQKASEQVLSLEGADDVFARLRAQHGHHASIVVFASVVSAPAGLAAHGCSSAEEDKQDAVAVPSCARRCEDCHTMYVGRYPIHPNAGATYEGCVLIAVSLPPGVAIAQVQYYIAQNGC